MWLAMNFRLLFVSLQCSLLLKSSFIQEVAASEGNKLLLVLLDGFRWDYLKTFKNDELPGFQKLRESGVRAISLKPDFPSLSYVNYYSLMTGLHAESHGMIHNNMYDPSSGKYFLMGKNPDQYNPLWWNDGEPLWVTAEKQGKRSYFWYWCGCEVEIRGVRPTFCQPYQSAPNPSFENLTNAFDLAIEVLRNGSADVAGVYFQQVDYWGHAIGPDGQVMLEVIRKIDAELLRVLNLLEMTHIPNSEKKLSDEVNVMIFADHGMTKLVDPVSGIVHLNLSLLSPDDVIIGSDFGPVLQIYTKENESLIYNRLKDLHPNVTVYLKEDIPERFFLKNHPRVPPLLLVADKGYVIGYKPDTNNTNVGFHGYDNEVQDMHGIFYAIGPDFQKEKQVNQLRNVDLYQIMCHVLSIKASPNNGTWDDVSDLLVTGGEGSGQSLHSSFPVMLMIMTLVVIRIAAVEE